MSGKAEQLKTYDTFREKVPTKMIEHDVITFVLSTRGLNIVITRIIIIVCSTQSPYSTVTYTASGLDNGQDLCKFSAQLISIITEYVFY